MVSIPLKNISQLGWLLPTYRKIKNVPNHQPDIYDMCIHTHIYIYIHYNITIYIYYIKTNGGSTEDMTSTSGIVHGIQQAMFDIMGYHGNDHIGAISWQSDLEISGSMGCSSPIWHDIWVKLKMMYLPRFMEVWLKKSCWNRNPYFQRHLLDYLEN